MCSSCGYKSLPYVLSLIALIEMVLGAYRVYIFFTYKPPPGYEYANPATVQLVPSTLPLSKQKTAAFIIDWISSIVPSFMGIYIALFILATSCRCFAACIGITYAVQQGRERCFTCCAGCYFCVKSYEMCTDKANHRCVSLTCNCPCYKARPRLRFQIRFVLLSFFLFLRIIATILYVSDKTIGIYNGYMAVPCAISVVLLCLVMAIDYYQYRVWWYYRPTGAYKKCRCCCCKQHFQPSHRGFLPFPLLGKHRLEGELGNRPCTATVSGTCHDLTLEHIAIFHAYDYLPQRRYQPGATDIYIGFHQTSPESAASIAQTGFRISESAPQMLGHGVYFARSLSDTEGKARYSGALFCAKIQFGRVRLVNSSEIHEVSNSREWWEDYDTIYYTHEQENRDEFCVKDPKQILEWIVIMNDDRMHRYGLDTEFCGTHFRCI